MVSGKKNVDYDMKHHPMDDLLRPQAAKRRSVRAWASDNAAPYVPPSLHEQSPAPDDIRNPFATPILADWEDLQPVDRRVYIAQRGAPLNGNTLPNTWPKVITLLVKQKYFTRDQFNAWGGIEVLKTRYESVRVRMRALFDAPEEPVEEEDITIRYSEGFDVYDLQPCATTKGIDAQPSSMSGTQDLGDEEVTSDYEDHHSASDNGQENAEAMPEECDIGGVKAVESRREDVYSMFEEYVDVEHHDQALPQGEPAEIRLSDESSLLASSDGQIGHNAHSEVKLSGVLKSIGQGSEGMKLWRHFIDVLLTIG